MKVLFDTPLADEAVDLAGTDSDFAHATSLPLLALLRGEGGGEGTDSDSGPDSDYPVWFVLPPTPVTPPTP
jgi:hypothetical protein